MAMAFYQLIPTLPVYIKEDLGGDKGHIGTILALFTVSALIIRPFTGMALDRYGRKWIFLIALFCFSLMFTGYILAGTLLAMAVLRLLHGLTWGVVTTSGSTVIVDILPRSRMGEGIGIYGMSMTLAMALGPLIGIWLTRGDNYHLIFLETSVCSMLFLFLALAAKYPKYNPPLQKIKFTWANLFERTSLLPGLNMLILMLPYGGIISFIALYGEEQGMKEEAGPFFILCAIGIALTRFFAGWIFDRHGPRLILIIGIILEMLAFPILALFPGEAGFLTAAFILGLGVGAVMPTFQAMVNEMIPAHRRGVANSTLFTTVDLGIGMGMVSVGMLGNWIGLSNAFLVCTLVCLTGLVLYLGFVHKYYVSHRLNNSDNIQEE